MCPMRDDPLDDEIREAYDRGKLCLFVGAGVSKGCHLPDWKELAKRVIVKAFAPKPVPLGQTAAYAAGRAIRPVVERNLTHVVQQIEPIESMRLAKRRLGNDFVEVVAKCLYPRRSDLVLSDTISAIVSLSGIRRIVCFNYDDLLEQAFEVGQRPYRCVLEGNSIAFLSDDTLIFHPHGYLPQADRQTAAATVKIVLTEDDYHELYAYPYCWANIIQLNSATEPQRSVCWLFAQGSKYQAASGFGCEYAPGSQALCVHARTQRSAGRSMVPDRATSGKATAARRRTEEPGYRSTMVEK